MKLLSFLRFRPPAETEGEDAVDQKYKYWRWRTFYGMYIGYIFYYFSRNSFSVLIPSLSKDLGYTKVELGFLASVLAISYGLSKFLSGVLSDRANPRYFMGVSLLLTGVLNILFGVSSSIIFFAVFIGLNGYFQGYGAPTCARLLTHWYSQKERGTWWGFWNTSHSVGGALIPLLSGFCCNMWGWRYGMYVPGALCIMAGLFVINRLRSTPTLMGLPTIEEYKQDYSEKKEGNTETKESAREILFKYVLRNKFIWILGIAYFFIYVIRQSLHVWSTTYLVESKGYNILSAASCLFWFEMGGIFGSLFAGWASDKIFSGRRGPINVLFSLIVIMALGAFWFFPGGFVLIDSILMFVIGFLIFGPQMLIGMVAAEQAGKKAAGSATGFVGLIAYLGAAVAGAPMGKICEVFEWQGFFAAVGICGAVAVLLLLPLWKLGGTKQVEEKEELALEEIPVDDQDPKLSE